LRPEVVLVILSFRPPALDVVKSFIAIKTGIGHNGGATSNAAFPNLAEYLIIRNQ
jgi:hypothetical protein